MTTPGQTSDVRVATQRTGWNVTIAMIVAYVINRFTAVDIDMDNPIDAAALGAVAVVVYRLSMWASSKSNFVAYMLFGTAKRPSLYE